MEGRELVNRGKGEKGIGNGNRKLMIENDMRKMIEGIKKKDDIGIDIIEIIVGEIKVNRKNIVEGKEVRNKGNGRKKKVEIEGIGKEKREGKCIKIKKIRKCLRKIVFIKGWIIGEKNEEGGKGKEFLIEGKIKEIRLKIGKFRKIDGKKKVGIVEKVREGWSKDIEIVF